MEEKVLRDATRVNEIINIMTRNIDSHYKIPPLIVGIKTGGIWIAKLITKKLKWPDPICLDVSFYRDDLWNKGIKTSSQIISEPINFEGKSLLLVDDILLTGRTVRAALNVLFDFGRPRKVDLAILYDRNGKELPISPTFTGEFLDAPAGYHFKLRGPMPITLARIKKH